MASEDSDEMHSRLSLVHRLHDLEDVDQTAGREVQTPVDHVDTSTERLEVLLFGGTQGVPAKERDYRSLQVPTRLDHVLVKRLLVVVVAPVLVDRSDAEEFLQLH